MNKPTSYTQFEREAVEDAIVELRLIAAKPREKRTITERILLGLSLDGAGAIRPIKRELIDANQTDR